MMKLLVILFILKLYARVNIFFLRQNFKVSKIFFVLERINRAVPFIYWLITTSVPDSHESNSHQIYYFEQWHSRCTYLEVFQKRILLWKFHNNLRNMLKMESISSKFEDWRFIYFSILYAFQATSLPEELPAKYTQRAFSPCMYNRVQAIWNEIQNLGKMIPNGGISLVFY